MKSNKFKVGIIGNGFVGEAQAFAFSPVTEVLVYDIDPLKSLNELEEVHNCDFVFVCVPTPMNKNGSQDLSFVENVFEFSNSFPIYIIKSTLIPGSTDYLCNKYPNHKIVFSPEFLTERKAKLDIITQSRIVIGGNSNLIKQVEKLFQLRFKNKNIIKTDSKTAELIKYMNNTFFATKVSIMNEFKLISDKIGADWEKALHGFTADGRIGDSHLNVPGPDGDFGYGGTCFPKDVNAFIVFADSKGIDLKTIKGGWSTNIDVRKNKDWNNKFNRSVNYK